MFLDLILENQFVIVIGSKVYEDESKAATINCLVNNAGVVLSLNWSSRNLIIYLTYLLTQAAVIYVTSGFLTANT
jgi:hypothetical protein